MNKILLAALCFLALASEVNAQAVNISKSVEPTEVLVGGEVLVAILININESQTLRLVEKLPSAFDVVSFASNLACTQEVQELTNARIMRCEVTVNKSERFVYSIKAKEGGVYNLPEVTAVMEKGAELTSRSNARITVGVPELLPTTTPPPTTPPPKSGFSPTALLFKVIGFIGRVIAAIFPEPVRLLLLGLILFTALVLFIVVAFHVVLRKG